MLPIAIDMCFSKIHKTKELPPNECVAIADAPIRIRTSRVASNNIEKKIWYEIESAHLKSTSTGMENSGMVIALLNARRILKC
ncbi:hypothetical protein K0M31_009885 [Melipona bicolor]|uniref:Uncharacterized protein n=1 Tax=Melipona bicolor TaxID=60889 RepID=A0AA40KIW3_9HYME|nr:hypothetical protein K0M31_009885 [Melipona bicolor]